MREDRTDGHMKGSVSVKDPESNGHSQYVRLYIKAYVRKHLNILVGLPSFLYASAGSTCCASFLKIVSENQIS